MSPVRAEMRKLASLSLPVVATTLSTMLMGFVDVLMVGHLSVEALAAASLGNVWVFGTLMFANGILFGIDPIVSQAHGAREGPPAALALQQGLVLAFVLSLAVAALWMQTERFLLLTGQEPALAHDARRYVQARMPGIPFFLAYSVLRQYLQGRELVRPAMWVILIANVFNVLFNWVLIFGHFGFPGLGLVGAGLATALTRVVALLGLVLWVRVFRLYRGAWVPWSRAALAPRGLGQILVFGVPVALQVCFETWAFSGAALLAGWLGAVPLAAHTIALNMAGLSFMIPLGLSQGAMTRVGNLIGARRPHDAQRAAWLSMALGAGVMVVSALVFVTLRWQLPRIYNPDPAVVALCASILPIAAAFQIFDGTQVVGCGVLRGMGRTRPAAVFNLIGYWLLGLPIGGWLAFRAGLGLAGIWWGLCFGLFCVASLLVLWIARRGPATLARPSGADAEAEVRLEPSADRRASAAHS